VKSKFFGKGQGQRRKAGVSHFRIDTMNLVNAMWSIASRLPMDADGHGADGVSNDSHHLKRGVLAHAKGGDGKDGIAGADAIDEVAGQRGHAHETLIVCPALHAELAGGHQHLPGGELAADASHDLLQIHAAFARFEADFLF